jgi:hypothetical protein
MSTHDPDARAIEDPNAHLEQALIEDFIRAHGHDPASLHEMPADQRDRLQKEAIAHAAAKLAEVASRAHFVHELHGDH